MRHIFECASEKTDNDDDFQTTFGSCNYQMGKHINHTIAKKEAERKARYAANGVRKETKGLPLRKELDQIKEDRIRELNFIREIALCAKQINQWVINARNTEEYHKNKELASKSKRLFEENHCDKITLPFNCVSTHNFEQCAINSTVEIWGDEEIALNARQVDKKYKKLKTSKDRVWQCDCADDSKRTVRRLSVLASPMCAIPPAEGEQFWAGRWSQNSNFDYEQVNRLYLSKEYSTNP
jgi:hypothetical protein